MIQEKYHKKPFAEMFNNNKILFDIDENFIENMLLKNWNIKTPL